MTPSNCGDCIHIGSLPVQVDRKDCLRSRRNRLLDPGGIHTIRLGINIHEYRLCSRIPNGRRRRHKRERDSDHFSAGTDTCREQRQMQRTGAAVDGHAITGATAAASSVLGRLNFTSRPKT